MEKPNGPCLYKQGFHATMDPGPMQYFCKVTGCTTFRGARFCLTTEEELVVHWNTFHVAVLPHFTCQHSQLTQAL